MSDSGPSDQNQRNKPPSWRRIIANLVDAYAEGQRTKANQKPPNDRAANWTAGATVAIAAFTFATIGVGVAQWNIQSRTLDEMRSEQSASLFVKDMKIAPNQGLYGKDLAWLAVVSWQNGGNTQTRHLQISFVCPSYIGDVVDPYIPQDGFQLPWTNTKAFMGPKAESNYGGCRYYPAYMDATLHHKMRTFILATAIYEDVWRIPHLTEYCAEIAPGEGSWLSTVGNITPGYVTNACPVHNCADDECPTRDFQYAKSVLAKQND